MKRGSAVALGMMLAGLLAGSGAQAQSFMAYGVYGKVLVKIDAASPGNANPVVEVTGLQTGEGMVGIEYDAANNQLYVVTDQNNLYTLNQSTAVATQVGSNPFADPATHTVAAFEIIPATDEARIITSSNQNFRINLQSGQSVASEDALTYAVGDAHEGSIPVMGGAAYGQDNTLHGLDENLNTLVRIGGLEGSPSAAGGSLTTIGGLGDAWNQQDVSEGSLSIAHPAIDGMDVGPDGSLYIAKAKTLEILFSGTAFYRVDPATGVASYIHSQNTNQWRVKAFTVVNDFDPASDIDGDGVLDPDDACPGTPPNTYVSENGCTILYPVDVTPVLVTASEKCNSKGFCKRKIELQVLKTEAVENRTVMVSFYASIDGQVSGNDTLLGSKKAKFNKKTGIAKVKYKAKLADVGGPGLQVIAVADSLNEVAEVDENNNSVAVPKP